MSDSEKHGQARQQYEVEVSIEESGSVPVEATSPEDAREKVENWAYADLARNLTKSERKTAAVRRVETDGGERQSAGTTRERPDNHVSVFPYPGGKGRQASWLLDKIPDHTCYVEVFGGSGALLYNKPESSVEVYNDINDDLVQFFRVLREREGDLLEWLRDVPYSRSLYEEWVTEYFDGHRPAGDLERAGRFFTLRYMQFAGDISMKNGFKTRAKRSPARTFDNGRERLEELANRFRQVIIEHQDWRDILDRYDDTETDVVFYCDPPYVDTEHYYGREFDHEEFVDVLADVESDWMVSYAELPAGLEDYHVLARDRRHRMCRGASEATEHLVCNFDPKKRGTFVDEDTAQSTLKGVSSHGD